MVPTQAINKELRTQCADELQHAREQLVTVRTTKAKLQQVASEHDEADAVMVVTNLTNLDMIEQGLLQLIADVEQYLIDNVPANNG